MKKNIKYGKVSFFTFFLLWVIMIFLFQPWDSLKEYVIMPQGTEENSSKVYGTWSVKQTFKANGLFDSIDIGIDNYNNTYRGSCIVKIYDENGRCIYKRNVDKTELGFGWLEIHLEKNILAYDQNYEIEISAPQLKSDNSVVVFYADENTYGNGKMTLYGRQSEKTMCFSVYDSRRNFFAYVSLFVFLVSFVIWWYNRKKSIYFMAAVILLGTGLSMLVMMAPMSSPDEYYHYHSAFVLSNIMLNKNDVYSYEEEYLDFDGMKEHCNMNSAYIRVMGDIFEKNPDLGNVMNSPQRSNPLRHPIIYLAPALGISLGRLLGFNFVRIYYLGSLFQLLLYTSLSLAAIRMIPIYKELLLFVAALPMCMQQAVSHSYDSIANGMSFLIIAYILKLAYENVRLTWKNVFVLVVIGGILCPHKLVYSTCMLLVFLIPKENFINNRDRGVKLAVIIGSVLLIVFIIQFMELQYLAADGQSVEAARKYSVRFALDYPGKYVKLFYRTISDNFIWWLETGIGSNLAGYTVSIPRYLVWGFLVLLLSFCFRKDENIWMPDMAQRLLICGAVVCGIGLVFVALSGTEAYGKTTVTSIQGRYFIPFILPFFIGIRTKKIMVTVSKETLFYLYWLLQAGVIQKVLGSVMF